MATTSNAKKKSESGHFREKSYLTIAIFLYIWPVKKITAISLVLLLSLQCFYKLGVITYFQLNRDYIAEVLCINKEEPIAMCYGKCFLDKNLALADTSADDATAPVGKQQIEFPIFLISANAYNFSPESISLALTCPYIKGASTKHSAVPFHPPTSLV